MGTGPNPKQGARGGTTIIRAPPREVLNEAHSFKVGQQVKLLGVQKGEDDATFSSFCSTVLFGNFDERPTRVLYGCGKACGFKPHKANKIKASIGFFRLVLPIPVAPKREKEKKENKKERKKCGGLSLESQSAPVTITSLLSVSVTILKGIVFARGLSLESLSAPVTITPLLSVSVTILKGKILGTAVF